MENLIINSSWQPDFRGEPKYFLNVGPISYDTFCLKGNRTCSLTINRQDNMVASNCYQSAIYVKKKQAIEWGYYIRCIKADFIVLVAEFFDINGNSIGCSQQNITSKIGYEFKQVMARFPIPYQAIKVKLSIQFKGEITACTYCAPVAYFC